MSTLRERKSSQPVPLHATFVGRFESVQQRAEFPDAVLATARKQFQFVRSLPDDPGRPLNYRMVLFETYLLYLHLEFELFGRGHGANFCDMQEFATKLGICASRTVSNVLNRMIENGRLERVPSPKDLRIRRLIPTDLFLKSQWSFSNCYLEGLSVLGTCGSRTDLVRTDIDEFLWFRHQVGKAYGEGVDPVRPFGVPAPFLSNRVYGSDIFYYLLGCNFDTYGRMTAGEPFLINLSFIADVLQTSRSHIRNVLQGLVERNLIDYELQLSRVTLSPEILASHQRATACVFILYEVSLSNSVRARSERRSFS